MSEITVQPTLIIGLGGTGTLTVSEIKKLAYELIEEPYGPTT